MQVQHEHRNAEIQRCPERGGRFTRLASELVELFRHREHGKTARTLSICMCVLGAITAISTARTFQYFFLARGASKRRLMRRESAAGRRNSAAQVRRHTRRFTV